METWEIVLIVVAGVLALLFLLGTVGVSRRRAHGAGSLEENIGEADRALAAARASDRGWDRALLEQAAREAFAARGADVTDLELVQVVDRPGTDEDRARFRALGPAGPLELELARSGDTWHAA